MTTVDAARIAELSTLSLLAARATLTIKKHEAGQELDGIDLRRLNNASNYIQEALDGITQTYEKRMVTYGAVHTLFSYQTASTALQKFPESTGVVDLETFKAFLLKVRDACTRMRENKDTSPDDHQRAASFFRILREHASNEQLNQMRSASDRQTAQII